MAEITTLMITPTVFAVGAYWKFFMNKTTNVFRTLLDKFNGMSRKQHEEIMSAIASLSTRLDKTNERVTDIQITLQTRVINNTDLQDKLEYVLSIQDYNSQAVSNAKFKKAFLEVITLIVESHRTMREAKLTNIGYEHIEGMKQRLLDVFLSCGIYGRIEMIELLDISEHILEDFNREKKLHGNLDLIVKKFGVLVAKAYKLYTGVSDYNLTGLDSTGTINSSIVDNEGNALKDITVAGDLIIN